MYPDSAQNLNYETDDAVYFFSTAYDPLNNWSAHQVKIWGQVFPTLEHAYHYKKFDQQNPEIAKRILETPSPWAAMQIERQHKSKRRTDWQQVKISIMEELCRAKLDQNEDMRERLMATGIKNIYENSPWDEFWGHAQGKGQNQMGKILMKLREELKNGE
ncbi:MAG TPA: NADAR family protein [Candidatus Saccharimonadales bacterium]|nr:NADAR family protein [Candidatus Saccharimonadales bacterium]